MREDHEVRYRTKALGVTKEQLAAAVKKVGNSAEAVRRELGKWAFGATVKTRTRRTMLRHER
jgi:hypothetical protein